MKECRNYRICTFVLFMVFIFFTFFSYASEIDTKIEEKVENLMEVGKIPGLILVIVKGDEPVVIKGFGYADLEKEIPVTPDTLFELASCSKAFTGLAALQLEKEGLVDLDEAVSKYLPWFYVNYEGQKYQVTIKQALYHTSGIPAAALDKIPIGDKKDALEQTIKNIVGIQLNHIPGARFGYSSVNYDIIGLIIEKASGMKYEDYMARKIFTPLGLDSTRVASAGDKPDNMAVGYKIGFFSPREYNPPSFRGNNPAAYIISNGNDMARWLKLQIRMENTAFSRLIRNSHRPDLSVRPDTDNVVSYAFGWYVDQYGDGRIFHDGWNPNFTSYIYLNPEDTIGIAVLTNSNSSAITFIADQVRRLIYEHENEGVEFIPSDGIDKAFSVISIILGIFLLGITAFLISIVFDLLRRRRRFDAFTLGKAVKMIFFLMILAPFVFGVYLIPRALSGYSWQTALVWAPVSFETAILLLLACLGGGYIGYVLAILFPHQNKYVKSLPMVIVLGMLSGGANAVIIFLITASLYANIDLIYLLYYFCLAAVFYITGRKVVQTKLIKITFDIVFDLRMKLVSKIFYTSYEKFEKIERGRIFATLNNDTGQIAGTANLFVGLFTSIITVFAIFIYLATIAFWATIVTSFVVATIATLYYIVSRKTRRYFEEARDTQNIYMGLLNGLIDGFKELSLHLEKKKEYKDDIQESCDQFRNKSSIARIRFLHAFLIGESLLIVVLAGVGFAVPRLFPDIQAVTLMGFIMVLLYLIGPINAILNAIPGIMQLKVAWGRVQEFLEDIPANIEPGELVPLEDSKKEVESIKARGLIFEYKSDDDEYEDEEKEDNFSIGPIDFEANKGEIVFIVGGNGSGKTTLAKVLTGLYVPDKGSIKINGSEIRNCQLGEYFSVVFGDYHLFEKIYNVNLSKKAREAHYYLKLLRLEDKVEFVKNSFSTIDLSGGQRKRLALLQCYLEGAPIFLFDEVAADQDPTFRKFFYRDLLQQMKEEGKIVIAITHDDHYFDAADKVIKMDMGKIEIIERGYKYKAARY